MPKMHGGQALVQSLHRHGVRVIFGLPGAGQYEAIDAIYEQGDIQYITTRNEQAISYMADGYARLSGQVGVGLAVQGPGFYNTTAGLATAFDVSSPVLLITGNRHRGSVSGESEYDSLPSYKAFTKWAGRATTPAQIPAIIQEAFRHLNTGRKRPVVIEIAPTVFAAEDEVTLLAPETFTPRPGDPTQLEQVSHLLVDAKRPLIWVGAGASKSAAFVKNMAERLQSPVVSSRSGKGVLSSRHPLSLGCASPAFAPLKARIDASDVILAIGTTEDFSDRVAHQTVIRIDSDPAEIDRNGAQTVGILGDARLCLEIMSHQLVTMTPPRPEVTEDIQAINTHRFGSEEQLQPQADFMNAIRSAIPDDGVLVAGMNQMGYYSRNYYPTFVPQGFQTCSHHGTLGSVFPIALGAQIAQPDRAMVSISGDGGALYNMQELATAVQYGIHAVLVVFNDNAYGNVWRAQQEQYGGHVIGTELHNPDFVKLAQAYGARGVKAKDASELESALKDALDVKAPTLIEVPVGPMERKY